MTTLVPTRFDKPHGDDDAFVADLVRSDEITTEVSLLLFLGGLNVSKPPLQIRGEREQARAFSDGGADLYIGEYPIQVKENKRYLFSGPWDFPREQAILDTSSGFVKHAGTVKAYLLYCRARKGLLVIPWSRYDRVEAVALVDSRYDTRREFAMIHAEDCVSAEAFIKRIKPLPGCGR